MTTVLEINALPSGARFYRADLHIHSFGGSHDVKDPTMTPSAIVQTALEENLDVIAVTDHNEITNVEATVSAANGNLLVVPGVELSTPDGHLLCYLPTVDALNRFLGRIDIVDRGSQISRCQTAILESLKHLEQLGGFGILAHVDIANGFEMTRPGGSPHKIDVLCHRALLGIELKAGASDVSYSDSDPDSTRSGIGAERISRLGLGAKQFLARVMNSDSHTLALLGKNAQGDRRVTRVKMDRPSFDALRIALEDADARIRIEDQIPPKVPSILGVAFEGGFLAGQRIHFSPNLSCIIGGRGTGKSTTFEAIRCLSGQPSDSSVVDSEVWPTALELFWCDQAGLTHTLVRPIDGEVSNVDNPASGPGAFTIESYGQGETARISKEAQNNPIALLTYLDRFVDLGATSDEEQKARNELLSLQGEIEKATKSVDAIPQAERELATIQQQLTALERANAKEVIELQRKLAEERELRSTITAQLTEIREGIDSMSPKDAVDKLVSLADPTRLAIGATELTSILTSARAFEVTATNAKTQTKASFTTLQQSADQQLAAWKKKEGDATSTIDAKRKVLEAQNIRLDMAYIQKLAKDEAQLKTNLMNLQTWKPHLAQLRAKHDAAKKRRWAARERIGMLREAFAKAASATLRSALTDLQVSVKFARSRHSPQAEAQISQAMGWRTIQVPRAALLIEALSVPELLTAIDRNDVAAILGVKTEEGAQLFNKGDANTLITRLSEPAIRFALERCEVHDLPRLTVTKVVTDANGKVHHVQRVFSKLSLGQQQSVLLALMLSSESNAPLIIDQPEDNLDGEFIYKTLVPVLRRAKERRQVIIVTHNPNIAVLGDAEQIIVLRSTSDKSSVVSRGSIDERATREFVCDILEGAREAFRRRARVYGLP